MRCVKLLTLIFAGCGVLWSTLSVVEAQSWRTVTPMPTARSEIASTALDGKIYVGGGLSRFGTTAAFEVLDPKTKTWRKLAPLPQPHHHLAMATANGRIYVTGGYANMMFRPNRTNAWAYDPKSDTWSTIVDLPYPRAAHAMATVDGKLYVVGGVGPAPATILVYDPKTESWDATRAPLPTKREHLAMTAWDGKLFVVGGRGHGHDGNWERLEIYNTKANTWTRGPDMAHASGGLTAAAFAGQVHVTGGEAFSPGRTFNHHQVYDPKTNVWSILQALPTARHGLTSAVTGRKWYVIGGGRKAGALTMISLSNDVEVYDATAR